MGRTVWWHEDGAGNMHFRTDQEVTQLIEANKFTRDQELSFKGDFVKVASIPLNVAFDSGFVQAHNEGDKKWTKRWLNDGDNRAWRCFRGSV